MLNRATQFASKTWSIPIANLELSLKEIVGGLESRVVRAIVRVIRRVTEAFGDSSSD